MNYTSTRNTTSSIGPQNKEYSVVIPMAGIGTRMKSYGPKCLLDIGGTSILDNQLKHINKLLPQSEIILVAGFESEKVREKVKSKANISVLDNPDFLTTNVFKSISLGVQRAKHDVILIYGDLVFNELTLKAPFGNHSFIMLDSSGYMDKEEVGCIVEHNLLVNMMYGLPNKWAQIAYFHGKELELLKKAADIPKYGIYFGFEIINIILNSGGKFGSCSPTGMKIIDIDSSKQLPIASEILR